MLLRETRALSGTDVGVAVEGVVVEAVDTPEVILPSTRPPPTPGVTSVGVTTVAPNPRGRQELVATLSIKSELG